MSNIHEDRAPKVAKVDTLVDELGSPIEVERDSSLEAAGSTEESIGAAGPTNWWRIGLVALLVIAAAILLGRVLSSGDAGPESGPAAVQSETSAP
jgi:hypothetical protein